MEFSEGLTQNNELVDVDEFVGYIGEFGKKQIILHIIFCSMVIPTAFQPFLMIFVANNPAWMCTGINAECNQTDVIFDIRHKYYDRRCQLKNRSSWKFVKPKKFSIVTEWDLVCDKKELSYLANSAYFLGAAAGTLLFGYLSDRFGRKPIMFFSLLTSMVCGFASGFVQSFWLFFTLRIAIGFLRAGSLAQIIVLAAELVGPRYRPLSTSLIWLAFATGQCLLGLKAWLLPDWRMIEIIVSAPYAVTILCWFFIPESIRWLRVKDRLDEAEDILRKAAKTNGKQIPNIKLSAVIKDKDNGTLLDLFRPWFICKVTLVQCFLWSVNGMIYFGISLASDDLGGDMYRDFILTSLVEFPANIMTVFLANRYGRKKTAKLAMFFSGLSCGIIASIPNNKGLQVNMWLRVFFGLLGKFFITLSADTLYVWALELTPTVVRSQGMSLFAIEYNIGSFGAPWIAQWLNRFHPALSFSVMGCCSLIASGLCFLVKETKSMPTAEVITPRMKRKHIETELVAIENECLVEGSRT